MENRLLQTWHNTIDAGVPVFGRFEAAFGIGVEYKNPYDPDEVHFDVDFIAPSGMVETSAGFWYEAFTRDLMQGQEVLHTGRHKEWRVRFSPREAGEYRYRATLTLPQKHTTYTWPADGLWATFTATAAGKRGFVRTAGKSHLCTSDGAPFFAIGHNLCGWEWGGTDNRAGSFDYDIWLQRLAENGGNATHFHFGEGNQLEWTHHPDELPYSQDWAGLGNYNQRTAFLMDRRVEKAEQLGIFFRLTLFHWEDFDDETDCFPDWGWNRNPYNTANNGPCANVGEFFRLPVALHLQKKLLRYVTARWGYSANLLWYELWNEIDAPEVQWGDGAEYTDHAAVVRGWHRKMAGYLKQLTPERLVSTSYADSRLDDAVWQLPELDVTTVHRYTYFNPEYGDEQFEVEKTLNGMLAQRTAIVPKPLLAGEFSLSPGGDIQKDFDRDGLAFHNSLWASLMGGWLGTAMHWTWGSYIHEYDLYHHYRPLAAFAQDEDFANLTPFDNLDIHKSDLLYMGLAAKDRAYLWVRSREQAFAVGGHNGLLPVNPAGIQLPNLTPGNYRLEWLDLASGETGLLEFPVEANGHPPVLPSCPSTGDVAIKIKPKKTAIVWQGQDIPAKRNSSYTKQTGKSLSLRGTGEGLYGKKPEYHLASAPAGDSSCCTVRLNSLSKTGQRARAGLVLHTDGAMVGILADAYGNLTLATVEKGETPLAKAAFPLWLRAEYTSTGNQFSWSANGAVWHRVPTIQATGAQPAKYGLLVYSGDDFRYADTSFEEVAITHTEEES